MGLLTPNVEKLATDEDVEGLLKCLKHKKADIRLKAFHALQKLLPGRELIEKTGFLKDDPNVTVRTHAVLKMAQSGDKDIYDNLRDIIVNGSQQEKIESLRILADIRNGNDASLSNLLVLALNDKKAMVQIEAIRTMGAIGNRLAIKHLVEKIHDPTYTVRLEAVRALGRIKSDDTVENLMSSLTDNNVEVRKAAREALDAIGSEKSRQALNNAPYMLLVKRMNESVTSRQEVIAHIMKHKLKDAYSLLRKACFDEYKSVRIEAARALGVVRDREATGILIKLLEDPYYDIRIEAIKSLARMGDPSSLPALEKAMEDFNKNVRDEAKNVYYQLKSRFNKNEED